MASPTHVTRANRFPPLVGWCRIDSNHLSMITFNSLNLSFSASHFPLMARCRVYNDEGYMVSEFFTQEIKHEESVVVCLNNFVDVDIKDGLFELNVFSLTEEGMKHSYFNEVWGTVVAKDATLEVNYPLLLSRGASPTQVDASTHYYPGIALDDIVLPSLLVLNHHEFPVDYEVAIFSKDGSKFSRKKLTVNPKRIMSLSLPEIFSDAAQVLSDGPGMLVFKFEYKLSAYVQTRHAKSGLLYGMDHVGILFAAANETAPNKETHLAEINQDRDNNEVICYCEAVSRNELKKYKDNGEDVVTAMQSTRAGNVCMGCISDIETMFGQKVPQGVFCKKRKQQQNQVNV